MIFFFLLRWLRVIRINFCFNFIVLILMIAAWKCFMKNECLELLLLSKVQKRKSKFLVSRLAYRSWSLKSGFGWKTNKHKKTWGCDLDFNVDGGVFGFRLLVNGNFRIVDDIDDCWLDTDILPMCRHCLLDPSELVSWPSRFPFDTSNIATSHIPIVS